MNHPNVWTLKKTSILLSKSNFLEPIKNSAIKKSVLREAVLREAYVYITQKESPET